MPFQHQGVGKPAFLSLGGARRSISAGGVDVTEKSLVESRLHKCVVMDVWSPMKDVEIYQIIN